MIHRMQWHEPSAQDPTLPASRGDETTWASGSVAPVPHLLVAGAAVGRFTVESQLGSGGMGSVYSAIDPQLGRRVALKLLHRSGDGSLADGAQQRLVREAQAMARVAHPNLVMVFEVGSHEGHVYIAMEHVQGMTLRGWLDMAPRSVTEVLRVFSEAGRGLAAAHAAGLVHRDFKPANVLVSDAGRVQVTDFGLARSSDIVDVQGPTQSGDPLAVHLTQTGAMTGTPAYMAPEQFEGARTDARTDEFAFCVALFEALYGQRPFSGDTTVALMTSVLAGKIAPPPPRPGVPRPLYDVLARGMSRRPEDRFADLPTLLAAIEGSGRRATPRAAWVVGGVLALGSLVAAPFVWSWSQTEGKPAARDGSRRRAVQQAKVEAAPLPDTPPAKLTQPETGLRLLAEHHAQQRFRGSLATWTAAEHDFSQACAQPGAPARWCAAAPHCAGMAQLLREEHSEARASFEAAIALDGAWAAPHLGRAAALMQLGQLDPALAAATEASRLEPDWVLPLQMAADVHISADRLDDAVAELRRALELSSRPTGPGLGADTSGIHSDLALVYHAQGLDSEAVRYAELALGLDEEDLSALVLLAERALENGHPKRALELATRASAAHPNSVPAWLARADALALLGELDKARDAYQKAVAAADASPDHGADPVRVEAARVALAAGALPTPALSPTNTDGGGGVAGTGRSSKSGGRSKKDKPNNNAADDLLEP